MLVADNLIYKLNKGKLMPYRIYETETFSRLYEAMEKIEQEWVGKLKLQLTENPHTGKPLKFDWFREKKFGDKRLYYLIYKDLSRILFVAFGSKKEQQKIIDHVLKNKVFNFKIPCKIEQIQCSKDIDFFIQFRIFY